MSKLVDVIIVNWNSGPQLAECIESIQQYGSNQVKRIIVVDNGSSDNSYDVSNADNPPDIIRSSVNLGFAKACNLGVTHSTAPYLLFLNPDAQLMVGSLVPVLAFMEGDQSSNVGICGVQLIDESGSTQQHCARFPSWRTYFGQAMRLNKILPFLFRPHFMLEFDHRTSRVVDQVIGAFFLVRRDLFAELKGFDERFFIYFEELDFSLRAQHLGWSTWYLSEAVAFHRGGGITEQVKAHRLFYSLRSRIFYAFKHFSLIQAWIVIGTTFLIEPFARLVRALLRRSVPELRDTVKGYCMLLTDLPQIFRKIR